MHINGNNKIGLIGSRIAQGQNKAGVELGPSILRSQNMLSVLNSHCESIFDFGDIVDEDNGMDVYQKLSDKCQKSAALFEFTTIIGGDHSQAVGSIHGLKQSLPDLKVIWVDAHGDINTPETSPTGNLHGMPLAALLGLFDFSEKNKAPWFKPVLKSDEVALIGVRDLDAGERKIIEQHGIFCLSAEETLNMGIEQATSKALSYIDPKADCPLHLSVDVDCLSEEFISATGLPVKSGFSPQQLNELIRKVALTGRLSSAEIVEFNPLLAYSQEDLEETVLMIFGFLQTMLQNNNKLVNEPIPIFTWLNPN